MYTHVYTCNVNTHTHTHIYIYSHIKIILIGINIRVYVYIYIYIYIYIYVSKPLLSGWLVGWLVVLFYGVSKLLGSFTAELNFKQFSLV